MCIGLGPLVGVLSVLYGEEGASMMVKLGKLAQGAFESLPFTVLQSLAMAQLLTTPDKTEGRRLDSSERGLLHASLALSLLSLSMNVESWRVGPKGAVNDTSSDDEDDVSTVSDRDIGWDRCPGWLKMVRQALAGVAWCGCGDGVAQ